MEDIKNTADRALNRMTTIQEEKLPSLEGKIDIASTRLQALEDNQKKVQEEEKAKLKAESRAKVWRIVRWTLIILTGVSALTFFFLRNWIEDLWDIT